MTNQPVSLFDTPVPGVPSNKLAPVSNDRGFGDFKLSLNDLVANIISVEQERLYEEYDKKLFLEHFESLDDINLLSSIGYSETLTREGLEYDSKTNYKILMPFRKKMSLFYETESGYESFDTPILIRNPKRAYLLFSLLGFISTIITIFAWFNGIDDHPTYVIFWGVSVICWSIFIATISVAKKHKKKDLGILAEARAEMSRLRTKQSDELQRFKDKLDSDDVFLLENLVAELNRQKKSHDEQKVDIELALKNSVEEPREQVRVEIAELNNQLNNIFKLKDELGEDDYERKKVSLQELIKIKRSTFDEFVPQEQAIRIELRKFDAISRSMDQTIEELSAQKTNLMSKTSLALAINKSLGEDGTDWDYARKVQYQKALSVCLGRLQSLNDSLLEICFAANNALAQLPSREQLKELSTTIEVDFKAMAKV